MPYFIAHFVICDSINWNNSSSPKPLTFSCLSFISSIILTAADPLYALYGTTRNSELDGALPIIVALLFIITTLSFKNTNLSSVMPAFFKYSATSVASFPFAENSASPLIMRTNVLNTIVLTNSTEVFAGISTSLEIVTPTCVTRPLKVDRVWPKVKYPARSAGLSQGSTQFFIMLRDRPILNLKVKSKSQFNVFTTVFE